MYDSHGELFCIHAEIVSSPGMRPPRIPFLHIVQYFRLKYSRAWDDRHKYGHGQIPRIVSTSRGVVSVKKIRYRGGDRFPFLPPGDFVSEWCASFGASRVEESDDCVTTVKLHLEFAGREIGTDWRRTLSIFADANRDEIFQSWNRRSAMGREGAQSGGRVNTIKITIPSM